MSQIKINANERSWAINLISLINKFVDNHDLLIKNVGGESTILTGTERMFPDLILYGDSNQTIFLQGWELKMPDTSITDEVFIKDAQRKAHNLGLNSTLIWNFTSAFLYVSDKAGNWYIKKSWNENSHITSRLDVIKFQDDWEQTLKDVILQVNEFLVTGDICSQKIDMVVTDSLMANIIENNKESIGNVLRKKSNSNRVIEAYIMHWWEKARTEYVNDEQDPYIAYGKMIILNWLNKFLFAHLIKVYQSSARLVDSISENEDINSVIEVFEKITEKCDFYNIFCKIEYSELIDLDTWNQIIEYNNLLKSMRIDKIDQNQIQDILENSVTSSKRLIRGQFTTPKILADILCNITMLDSEKDFVDCCCGTGTIAKAGYDLKSDKMNVEDALSSTWASDKDTFPLQLATIALSSVETMNKPLKVFNRNALNLKVSDEINVTDPSNGEIIKYNLPKMGTICSNLPFIAFERLDDKDKRLIEKIIVKVKDETNIVLSKRGDIYTYIPFALHDLLDDNGRLGIITSNSWLGTKSGKIFYSALKEYYEIEHLHISGNKKWFNNADVITVILVLEKKEVSLSRKDYDTSFFIWNKNLEELSATKEYKDNIIQSSILKIEPKEEVAKKTIYSQCQIDSILDLNVSLNSLFHDNKWLINTKNYLLPITDFFDIFRGSRRGWDQLFYPQGNHGIEEIFIKKVLKNARNVNFLKTEAQDDVFCCSKTKKELRESNHLGALAWIEKFENEVNGVGKPIPEVLSRKNLQWYEIETSELADFFTMMNPDKRLFFGKFEEKSFINQRLIGLRVQDLNMDRELLHALLNSILSIYYIEALGFGRGLGVLDINKDSIASMYILNPNNLNECQKQKIKELFSPILEREIYDYEQELNKEDRIAFDKYVLDCYGLSSIYADIKNSFLSMHKSRRNI
ncbi:N-6 DNA methylase [Facklamia sp. P12950]|uniref:N-6 DNA methylase n=1 Tax=Facklamia sp. P12950 TaxID=3421951 RepID=UPI003D171A41